MTSLPANPAEDAISLRALKPASKSLKWGRKSAKESLLDGKGEDAFIMLHDYKLGEDRKSLGFLHIQNSHSKLEQIAVCSDIWPNIVVDANHNCAGRDPKLIT